MKKIVVLGSRGFIGRALVRNFEKTYEVIPQTRNMFDVSDSVKFEEFLVRVDPDFVLNATGKVAGISGNIEQPATLLLSNVVSSISVMKTCHRLGIKNLVQFASACVYPLNSANSSVPTDLFSGRIESTSSSYAAAKLMVLEATSAFNREFGYNWTTFIPTNLYGPGDWTFESQGHVVSMLMKRFIDAVDQDSDEVVIWGDGKSLRSFLFIDDLATAVQKYVEGITTHPVVNLSGDSEVSIFELASLIATTCGFTGRIVFDPMMPNGARRKILNDSIWRATGWRPETSIDKGLGIYLDEFRKTLE